MTDNEIINIGDVCTYSFNDTKNQSLSIVEVVKELSDECVVVMFHQVIFDDSGNNLFTYLCKSGKTMNVSRKYLSKIDLINRQKAQIEGLQDEVVIKTDMLNRQKAEIERLRAEIKGANEAEREAELQALKESKENAKLFCEAINYAKTEAIKEFAERLTDKADLIKVNTFDNKWAISQDEIDNLVKEWG